jgi:hypothetical protein
MQCIKTGAHIFLHQYNVFAICDAFEMNGVHLFRIAETSPEPFSPALHFDVWEVVQWFEKNRSDGGSSTLIASSVLNHGYVGKHVKA